MLPRQHRLREPEGFARAVKSRCRCGSRTLVVHLGFEDTCPQPDHQVVDKYLSAYPQVGLVVSKAVGGAVVRTRVKRRLRHAVTPLLPDLPAGSRLVIRANPAAADAEYRELMRDLTRCVRRVLADESHPTRRKGQR